MTRTGLGINQGLDIAGIQYIMCMVSMVTWDSRRIESVNGKMGIQSNVEFGTREVDSRLL